MCAISESEISVPMEISAAALSTASRSSGRRVAKSVVAAFVRKPEKRKEINEGQVEGERVVPIRRMVLA